MKTTKICERLAVCSWSLQAANPHELVDSLLATGIRRLQLALDPLRQAPEIWGQTEAEFQKYGIAIVSGMFGCVGEDYSTLESIRLTGGIAPDHIWPQNLKNIQATAVLAEALGLNLVTFHAGFLPHDESDPAFGKMAERLAVVADTFAARNIQVGLETGQESAQSLATLLRRLNRSNLGVNFDPANILLYGQENVPGALRILQPWIRQVHIKDALRAETPGTWGTEVAAGTGEVDWRAFFATLGSSPFTGHAVIEREAGKNRVADIRTAKELVESLT